MRRAALALVVTLAFGAMVPLMTPLATELEAQEQREKKVRPKTVKRTPPPKGNAKSGGYPPCGGIMWVDSLCQLPDGRICFVDEHELINCMR